MHDGVEDGVIKQSEYLVAKLSSDHMIPKKVSNSFIETVKYDDFNPNDIRFDRIQPIENLISKAQRDNTRIQSSEGRRWGPGSHAYCEAVEADNQAFVGGQGIVNACHSRCTNAMVFAFLALPTVTYSGR